MAEERVFAIVTVIPAQAGIQSSLVLLDSRLRGSDEQIVFFSILPMIAESSLKNEAKDMAEERIVFDANGLKIEALFENLEGEKGVVVSHPHPLYGGSMHNNVVMAVAQAYREHGYSTLRFNFRGVGLSEGDYDNGNGEKEDVHAALRYLTKLGKTKVDLAGYSFGSWVNALGIEAFKDAERLIMVSPPVDFIDFSFLKYSPKIQLVICGTLDDIAGYKKVGKMLPLWNREATFRVIEGADHFYFGYEDEIRRIIGEFLGTSD